MGDNSYNFKITKTRCGVGSLASGWHSLVAQSWDAVFSALRGAVTPVPHLVIDGRVEDIHSSWAPPVHLYGNRSSFHLRLLDLPMRFMHLYRDISNVSFNLYVPWLLRCISLTNVTVHAFNHPTLTHWTRGTCSARCQIEKLYCQWDRVPAFEEVIQACFRELSVLW